MPFNTYFSVYNRRMINNLKQFIAEPLGLVAIVIVAYLADFIIPIDFNRFGIHPRSILGLFGIPLSPFLHGGFGHLFSNVLPLFVLGVLIRTYGRGLFISSTVALIALSGLLTWVLSSAVVVGASGLVFAYWTYLITTAIRQKTVKTIIIAGITLLLYGGLIFGLASFREGVSWAGHFSGAVAGVLLAFIMPIPKSA